MDLVRVDVPRQPDVPVDALRVEHHEIPSREAREHPRELGGIDVVGPAGLERDAWELTVVTLDKPSLFSNICGVLSYYGMDILRVSAMTSPAGLVIDVFQFTDHEGFFRFNPDATAQVEETLREVVAGRQDVTALLRRKAKSVLRKVGPRRVAPVVALDNEHSQRYTVLEIVTEDALGLAHRISRVLSQHGCDVDLVLLSTEGKKAIDVFHLTRAGSKLTDAAQMALKVDLERMLEEGYETH